MTWKTHIVPPHRFVMYEIGEDRCGKCLKPRAAHAPQKLLPEPVETEEAKEPVCTCPPGIAWGDCPVCNGAPVDQFDEEALE